MLAIEILEEAANEAIAAANWYEQERAGLGHEFSQALDDVFGLLEEDLIPLLPLSGKSSPIKAKRVILKRFPYDIIVIERDRKIIVVAIAHHARRPGYWRDRVIA